MFGIYANSGINQRIVEDCFFWSTQKKKKNESEFVVGIVLVFKLLNIFDESQINYTYLLGFKKKPVQLTL